MACSQLLARLLIVLMAFVAIPARAADEPYDMYAILSLTGQAAFLGHAEQATINAYEKMVNSTGGIGGRPLHFIVSDDASQPANTVQLLNGIAQKHVAVFIGPSLGASCSALIPVVAASGPVMYCFANTIHPPTGSYSFSVMPTNKDFIATALRYLKAKGIRRIALLTTTDASGQDGENLSLENLNSPEFKDLQVVANEHFAVGDLTVSAQIARIKAAGAQAIDAWATGTPFGTVLRGVNEGGFDGFIMTSAANINQSQMLQYASFLPKNLIFAGPPYLSRGFTPAPVLKARKVYLDAMHAIGVAVPEQSSILAWDALLLITDALRHLGPNATATQMRDYLLKVHDFAGINGIYDFRTGDQRGLGSSGTVVVRWDPVTSDFPPLSRPGGQPLREQ